MAVNWGLIGPGFDALQSLNAAGQARREQYAWNKLERQEAQEQRSLAARQGVANQLQAGDYAGATSTALQSGDFDLVKHIGGLQADHKKELAQEAERIGGLAYSLRSVPLEQRYAIAVSTAQRLGWDTDRIPTTLDDQTLAGLYGWATSVKDQVAVDLTQARIGDVATDNQRQDMLANNTVRNTAERLQLARNADARGAAANARAAQARAEGRVRFSERDKDRAALAAGGRIVRNDLEDLDY